MKQRIPNFNDFLYESLKSYKTDNDLKKLQELILLNNSRDTEDFHQFEIPKNFVIYDKKVDVDKKDKAEPSQCYDNALFFAKKNPEYKLVIGYFIDKSQISDTERWMSKTDYNKFNPWIFMYPHAWNVTKKDEIYDITIDNDLSEWIYIGTEVDPSKFKTGFGDLSKYLNKIMKLKTKI